MCVYLRKHILYYKNNFLFFYLLCLGLLWTKQNIDIYVHSMPRSVMKNYMEASKPKWVNPVLDIIGVNSLRLGGLHVIKMFRVLVIPLYFRNLRMLMKKMALTIWIILVLLKFFLNKNKWKLMIIYKRTKQSEFLFIIMKIEAKLRY